VLKLVFAAVLSITLLSACDRRVVDDSEPQQVVADVAADPWPEAASVRLFVQKPFDSSGEISDIEMVREDGQLLTPAERGELEKHIRVVSYNHGPETAAACFVPHHFLRYYDAAGELIGELAICFCCKGIQDEPYTRRAKARGSGYSELTFTDGLEPAVAALGYDTRVDCFDKPAP
jgi:hypothetical protein